MTIFLVLLVRNKFKIGIKIFVASFGPISKLGSMQVILANLWRVIVSKIYSWDRKL